VKGSLDISRLKSWFAEKKRDLPWRQIASPYAVWISEVMLQQTQVSVVIPYFLDWMKRFPTPYHLAKASLDEVIKTWEGLGYYSRARHIHEAAKELVERFNGQLPSEEKELRKIKGLGPYTVGAILGFAFHQKKAAVDGNVIRVLSRYFGIEEDISKGATVHQLRQLAEALLPDEEPWIISEALIELGATVCQRKARCDECPLQESCVSFNERSVDRIPYNSKKVKNEFLYRSVAVIACRSSFLVKRGKKGAIMSDLYEFPYFEISKGEFSSKQLEAKIAENYALEVMQKKILMQVSHSFTRYQVQLYPILFSCCELKEIEGLDWFTHVSLKKLAFSSGHRRILQQLSGDGVD